MAVLSIALVSLLTVVAVTTGAAALPKDFQSALTEQSQIYIATRRADGSRSAAVPVWFWWDADNAILYTSTGPQTHKAKRIRRGSPVYIAVRGRDGPFFEGKAEPVTDLQLVERIGTAYARKYWLAWLGLFRPRADRVQAGKTLVIAVRFDG